MPTRRRVLGVSLRLATAVAALACAARAVSATTASLSPNGYLLVDGQPFFPIGIYHTSWIGDRNGAGTIPDLLLAADAGFNLLHPTIDNRDSVGDLLDLAQQRGVCVIGEVPLPASGPDDFINHWKAHPAIIGWNIADDFNAPYAGPAYNHPPAELAALHLHVHAIDPAHVTYASGGSYPGYRVPEFLGAMDLMGFQSYPLGAQNNPDDYALQENVDSFDWVHDQLGSATQLFIANPQAYRWSGPGTRYPTPREARNLLYAPLLRGAKGIVWYTLWEGASHHLPSTAPALWEDLRRQVAELKSLTPFLLHGARTELATGDPRLRAASWRYNGQLVVVVLSTERSVAHPIALPLPSGATGAAHVLFPDRPEAGMSVVAAQLVGTIDPEQVHVYLLDLTTPGNTSPTASLAVVPPTVSYGQSVMLDGAASSDADGTVVAWEWDLGDGTLAAGSAVSHAWARPGDYFVRLTARDDDGSAGTVIAPLHVGLTSLCAPAPVAGCKTDGASSINVRDPGSASRRTLKWSWNRAASTLAELGNPTATTEYALCLYDGNGFAFATGVRPSAQHWSGLGASGFRLRAASGTPGGISTARLKPGTSASLKIIGKGVELPPLPLPMALPVVAQLVTSDSSSCWQATYAAGPGTKNTDTSFRAKNS